MSTNNPPQNIDIELTEDIAEGIYSNLAIITHSNSEFVADFVKILPNLPKGKVKSRIILTPQHAKRLMRALQDNIQRYEQAYGVIREDQTTSLPLNFGPTAQA